MKQQAGELPTSVEGYDQAEWILADYGDLLVHIFSPKARETITVWNASGVTRSRSRSRPSEDFPLLYRQAPGPARQRASRPISCYARRAISPCEMREIRPGPHGSLGEASHRRKVFLDPAGKPIDSAAFAALIARAEMDGRDLVFLIGGADGLPAAWAVRADLLLSLSPMTFSHELARAMLAEQIYRAFATLRGHPYPR